MAWGFHGYNLAQIETYEAGLRHIATTSEFRDSYDHPLDTTERWKRFKHYAIAPWGREIHCKLYDTPMLIYHEDGQLDVRSQHTLTDGVFTHNVAPSGVSIGRDVVWLNSGGRWSGDHYLPNSQLRGYRPKREYVSAHRVDGVWEVVPESVMPFDHYIVDRKRANAALKPYPFREFSAWFAMYALHTGPVGTGRAAPLPNETLLAMLWDPNQWTILAQQIGLWTTMERLRLRVAGKAGAIQRESIPYVGGDQHLKTVRATAARYAHYYQE
jgi:hypothetical protein